MKRMLIQVLIILILGFIPYSVYTIEYAFTTIDVPGAEDTYVYGIDGKNIVGAYGDASGIHGFLYNGKTYTTLDVPGAMQTEAYDISGTYIIGYYVDAKGNSHGFLATNPYH